MTRRINGVTFDGEPFPGLNNVKWDASIDGQTGRPGDLGYLLSAPSCQHRLLLAAGRAQPRRSGRACPDAMGTRETRPSTSMPFVDPAKQIPVS